MQMCFGVFFGYTQIEPVWLENVAIVGDVDVFDAIVSTRVENRIDIHGERLAKVHVVAIGAQAFWAEWLNNNGALLDVVQNFGVRKDHRRTLWSVINKISGDAGCCLELVAQAHGDACGFFACCCVEGTAPVEFFR